MLYTPIFPFIVMTLLVLLAAVAMAIAITNIFRVELRFRDELAERVKFSCLDKMLAKRNIKREHYLHVESVTNIENQVRSCESCSMTEQCDQALKDSEPSDLSFCPNDEDFELIAKKQ